MVRLAFLFALFAAPAGAQVEPDVRSILQEAVREYDQHHYSEALALFRRAHEIEPTARTSRGLGMALFELRRYVESEQRLREALESDVRPLTDAQRRRTTALLERATLFIGFLRVDAEPEGAEVYVDRELVESGTRVPLDPGDHRVSVRAEGFDSHDVVVRSVAGETTQLDVILQPVETEAADPEVDPEVESELESEVESEVTELEPEVDLEPEVSRSRALPAVFMTLGAAMALGSIGTGLAARSEQHELEDTCLGDICPPNARQTRDRARKYAIATDALWIGGAVLVVGGLVGLLRRRATRPTEVACGLRGCVVRRQF